VAHRHLANVTGRPASWDGRWRIRAVDFRPAENSQTRADWASSVGTDFATYRREGPGVSAFALEDGLAYHTYSAYERGIDVLWGMYQWLDGAPLGRRGTGFWRRRHDEYDGE